MSKELEEARILLRRAYGQIEHLAECTENLGEDLEDDDVSEDVAEAREVAGEIDAFLTSPPSLAPKPSDAIIDNLRIGGMSIDGDNAYKRDLLDCVVGAMAFGKQGRPAPPESHWLHRFWEVGNAEREERDTLAAQLAELSAERDAALEKVAELEGQSGIEFVYDRDELVAVPRGLIGAACHAIDKKRDSPRTIAKLREYARGPSATVQQAFPEGWKLVPIKPSIEMVEAGYEASRGQPDRSGHARTIEQYDAMLAAAPQPVAQEGE